MFEFHTKRKRGVEDTLMATASARCYFTKVWINCIFCGDFCLAEQKDTRIYILRVINTATVQLLSE